MIAEPLIVSAASPVLVSVTVLGTPMPMPTGPKARLEVLSATAGCAVAEMITDRAVRALSLPRRANVRPVVTVVSGSEVPVASVSVTVAEKVPARS